MKSLLWHFGKLLQMLGLILAPYALYVGMSTSDAKIELKLLLISVACFIMGVMLVRATSEQ
ncbi:hypothetical protein GW915_08490 [bacterium]|nr:hypothetical protein [bacterium]